MLRTIEGSALGIATSTSCGCLAPMTRARSWRFPSTGTPWMRCRNFAGLSSRKPTGSYPHDCLCMSRTIISPASPAPKISTRFVPLMRQTTAASCVDIRTPVSSTMSRSASISRIDRE